MWSDLQFNALVFFTNQPSPNTRRTGSAMQRSYVRQTLALARSLDSLGKRLRVFTNNRRSLLDMTSSESRSATAPYAIEEVYFPSDIPPTIRFFASHQRLYLYSIFAQEAHYNCWLDTDVVANHAKRSLIEVLEKNPRVDGWVYDISDHVFPAYGTIRVQHDLRCELGVQHPFPRWYGGEFIIGNARLFSYLHEECFRTLGKYLEVSDRLHHIGDEILVSAALNNNYQNLILADAGASGLVVRQWTSKTLHVKKPPSVLKDSLFWHLPTAKSAAALYYRHGDLRILYRHIQGLSIAKHAVGHFREALRRARSPRGTPAIC